MPDKGNEDGQTSVGNPRRLSGREVGEMEDERGRLSTIETCLCLSVRADIPPDWKR